MKKILLFAPILMLSACSYSVSDAVEDVKEMSSNGLSDGTKITDTPQATDEFSGIASVGLDDVKFVTGDTHQISASGSAKALDKLRYKIKDGKIIVGREDNNSWKSGKDKAVITITAPSLSSIANAGSGAINADKVSGDNVGFAMAGSGTLKVDNVSATKAETSMAGSGKVVLQGTTASAEYSMAGSGQINASALSSETAEVSVAGSGAISLNASKTVDASMMGSGSVKVTGGAKCETSKMGSGTVSC